MNEPKILNWEEIIQEHEKSGMTQEQFCQTKQISIHTLKYHRAKRKSKSNQKIKTSFVELPSSIDFDATSKKFQEDLKFQMDIRIHDWFNLEIRLG